MEAGYFAKTETPINYKLNIFIKYRLSIFKVKFVK
jgi:hypothetical protein